MYFILFNCQNISNDTLISLDKINYVKSSVASILIIVTNWNIAKHANVANIVRNYMLCITNICLSISD